MKKLLMFFVLLSILESCNNFSKDRNLKFSIQDTAHEEQHSLPLNISDKKIETQDQLLQDSSALPQQTNAPIQNDWDKKIVKNAEIKMEVKDFKAFTNAVHMAAKQYGGYIANEELNQSSEKIESIISIKVPVDKFELLINQLPSGDNKVIERKVTTDDVTAEVVDTKSRLQSKEQMRLKYLEFIKQAKNMEDVLKVQSEINDIQEEIEAAAGRINYLSHQSSFSTINLTYFQPLPGYVPADREPGFTTKIIDAFKTGLSFITEMFVGMISIWPLFLFLIIIWVFYKKFKMTKLRV